ncbi:hypothetical protein [Streptomyces canus]|uniref:hypothetical protein n=1 Tax=Streptomyces canus TaxID=58343 RepID=UPI003594361E
MVGRRERGEIRTPGRPMPDHDGLPEGEHDPEHHAQHGDRTDAPDGGGAAVASETPSPREPLLPGERP